MSDGWFGPGVAPLYQRPKRQGNESVPMARVAGRIAPWGLAKRWAGARMSTSEPLHNHLFGLTGADAHG
jgi:hypothetical protein